MVIEPWGFEYGNYYSDSELKMDESLYSNRLTVQYLKNCLQVVAQKVNLDNSFKRGTSN